MLADYLKGECWHTIEDGVEMYKLPQGRLAAGDYLLEHPQTTAERYELFFCCGGQLILHRTDQTNITIRQQEILLFSDLSGVSSVTIGDPLIGYCVSVDPETAGPVFDGFYQTLKHSDILDGRIAGMLRDHGGIIAVYNSCWNQAVFSVLRSLPYTEQGHYCISKIAELFYLLCAHHALLDELPHKLSSPGYSAAVIHHVRDYMEEHLDEKLTIDSLSHRFHLSATALKTGFRAVCGQPIHTWLQNRRIQHAAELLQFTDLTILQIAQSVGYEGVSQFNVLFRRVYGMTPSFYRKMSDTGTF